MIGATVLTVLKDDLLYSSDNRVVCGEHAGTTARWTGYDINGKRVLRITKRDAAAWQRELGSPIQCEHCGAQFKSRSSK